MLALLQAIVFVELPEDDGLVFVHESASAQVIRDEDEYAGVRVSVEARLVTARPPFHTDVNFGDPIWPSPETVSVQRLRGGAAIRLADCPLHMVHAEKIVTAVQRGTVTTRRGGRGRFLQQCEERL